MVIPLMLLSEGEQPLYLAAFLKLRKLAYYDALLAVQMKLRWADWIELFLECTIASCWRTVYLLRELQHIKERWHEHLRARPTRKHATVWDLLLYTGIDSVLDDVTALRTYGPAGHRKGGP